jgi:L-alanine-DL-glutamate epimerase-like enolase superfamily enzyme
VASGATLLGVSRSFADELPRDVRITRIVGFDVVSQRAKLAGKNSRLDVHGDRATDRMVRIDTNRGITGIGNGRASKEVMSRLLGRDPFEYFRPEQPAFVGPFGPSSTALWDLAGKVLNKPVYELLGGAGPERVDVYDGSIYFADLLPRYASRPLDRFKEEIDQGRKRGHTTFKVKIGRGAKWMSRAEGDARDLDVLNTIRDHGGPRIRIGVDANNGYDLSKTVQLLDALGDNRLIFMEEMFPEQVEACLKLKEAFRQRRLSTLVADGETQDKLENLKPLIEARAVDVFQADMKRFGFEGILTEAQWAAASGLKIAPHNWGSWIGFYLQLHVGRAVKNFYMAEHDPLTNNVLRAPGFEIRDGSASVPAQAGLGITLDSQAFQNDAKIRYDLKWSG